MVSPLETIVVLVAVLLLFGPKKLPELAHSIGKSLGFYKAGLAEGEQMTTKPTAKPKKPAKKATKAKKKPVRKTKK